MIIKKTKDEKPAAAD
jgi:hypothetical protein